jgi:hypothetical protein
MTIRNIAISMVVICLAGRGAAAQADRYAPIVSQLPATPRASVLGTVAGARDIEAIFGNPALVGTASGIVAGTARYGEATLLSIASASSLGTFSVGVGASYLDGHATSDGLPLWSHALIEGGHLTMSSAVGGLALATTYRGLRVGGAVKYLAQHQGAQHDAVPSLDLGIAKDMARWTAGLTVQSIGAGIRFSNTVGQLPLRVSAGVGGVGFPVGPFDLSGAAGASVLPDGKILPAGGVELGYSPMEGYLFIARAGLRRPELQAQQPFSFGGSAGLDRFSLEYAYEDWSGGGAHRLALRVR